MQNANVEEAQEVCREARKEILLKNDMMNHGHARIMPSHSYAQYRVVTY
jgi:hypothetical protein